MKTERRWQKTRQELDYGTANGTAEVLCTLSDGYTFWGSGKEDSLWHFKGVLA